jgi:hypothetical protein
MVSLETQCPLCLAWVSLNRKKQISKHKCVRSEGGKG